MKKNLNVIQVKGLRGLVMLAFIGCCLFAGFIVFPGWLSMNIWNFAVSFAYDIPSIGLVQGVMLWGILIATYFILRKEKVVVCMKTPQGLSEDELRAVFSDIKKQAQDDKILQSMLKAREMELKIKDENSEDIDKNKTEIK